MNHLAEPARPAAAAPPAAATAPPLLEVRGLGRRFGPTVALAGCSLTVAAAEIHALVGENGSGKSTLIKILTGILPPDQGTLLWQGRPLALAGPRAARRAGIVTCFQETLVAEQLSVLDNIVMGQDGAIRRRRAPGGEAALARAALDELGCAIDLERPVAQLRLAQRQLVTIARALACPWRLLILDEATSALDVEDRDRLFAALARHRAAGRSILFVSHRMDEVARLGDRCTVLRAGRSVATLARDAASTARLLALMSAREDQPAAAAAHLAAAPEQGAPEQGAPVLRAGRLALYAGATAFDLEAGAGEILGLAGLEGHGQDQFLECSAGLAAPASGAILVGGAPVRSAAGAARAGVGFLPRDRKRDGIFAPLSVADNLAISRLPLLARAGLLSRARLLATARRAITHLRIQAAGPDAPIATLSGGNQQKVLLGRLLLTGPRVLALNDPMRGVDLGAKHDLYEKLRALAADGMTVLLLSTELAELCLLCRRVAVFRNQTLACVLRDDGLSEAALIAAMFGHREEA